MLERGAKFLVQRRGCQFICVRATRMVHQNKAVQTNLAAALTSLLIVASLALWVGQSHNNID